MHRAHGPVYNPLAWKLLPASAGYQAMPDGTDFGAEVTRILKQGD
jgi:hypothetical protein